MVSSLRSSRGGQAAIVYDSPVTGAKRGEKALVTPYLAGVGGRAGQSPERSMKQPLQTITSKADAALCVPRLVQVGYGEREGQAPSVPGLDKPGPEGKMIP